jgi:hypothetical protein
MRNALLALATLTAACAPASAPRDAATESAPPADAMMAAVDSDRGGGEEAGAAATPQHTLYLAYAYGMTLETPADRLVGVMEGHAAACRAAGPQVCQLISLNREGDAETYLSGDLSLRAEPQWLVRFMARIEADADAANGRVRAKSTTTEDLTRAIVDTEARLRAMTTLRDRLQSILATRPGRVADLLEVERELARVQGEIDSTQSNLAVMRARVDMSELAVRYQSAPRPVTASTLEPLRYALASFLGNLVQGLAAIVTLVALALPWAAVLGLVAWAGRAAWRRWKARREA